MGDTFKILARISAVVNTIADWSLIVAGLVLICWSFISVDVIGARYLLVLAGFLFFSFGCWFRWLSLKRKRKENSEDGRQGEEG